jgi:hypothetical protein
VKIALDYDKTFTLDPRFWFNFIVDARLCGHDVRVVTIRDDRLDRTAPLIDVENDVLVIYTRGVAKKWFCTHFGDGFVPDVWIDDNPRSILENSDATPEALVQWRAERGEP